MTNIKTIKEMKLHGTLNKLTEELNEDIAQLAEHFTDYIQNEVTKYIDNSLNVSTEIDGNYFIINVTKENEKICSMSVSIAMTLIINDEGKLCPKVNLEKYLYEWEKYADELKKKINK